MLTFVMDGPFVLERIDTSSLALMMPSGAVHPIIYAGNVIYASEADSFTAYFCKSGYCAAAKMKVSGMKPNTLNATQVSVVCVRQTISLSTANAKKNTAQRMVSLRQPSGLRWNIWSN